MLVISIVHPFFLLLQLLVMSSLSYEISLIRLSATQISVLKRVQNEPMRAVLRCTRDPPTVIKRFLPELPNIKAGHKHAQVKTYLYVAAWTNHLLISALHADKRDAHQT